METPIQGVYADEGVNACMFVHSGRAKYSVADRRCFNLFPLASSPHRHACLRIHVHFHGGHASHREPISPTG